MNEIKNLLDKIADWLELRQSAFTLFAVGTCLMYIESMIDRTHMTDVNILMAAICKGGWIFAFLMGAYMLAREGVGNKPKAESLENKAQ